MKSRNGTTCRLLAACTTACGLVAFSAHVAVAGPARAGGTCTAAQFKAKAKQGNLACVNQGTAKKPKYRWVAQGSAGQAPAGSEPGPSTAATGASAAGGRCPAVQVAFQSAPAPTRGGPEMPSEAWATTPDPGDNDDLAHFQSRYVSSTNMIILVLLKSQGTGTSAVFKKEQIGAYFDHIVTNAPATGWAIQDQVRPSAPAWTGRLVMSKGDGEVTYCFMGGGELLKDVRKLGT